MKIKIYSSDIIIFLFFHIAFITIPYFEYYDFMKYVIIVSIALYLLYNYKTLFKKKYRRVNAILTLFVLVVLITGYINKDNLKERNVFYAAIVFSVIVLEAFYLFQCFEQKNIVDRAINITYRLTVFYVVLTDMLLILYPKLVLEQEGYYLIGNKFSVVYTHLLMLCLYWFVKGKTSKNNRFILLILYALTLFVSFYIDSTTGVIGSILLFLFMVLYKKIGLFVMKPFIPVVILIVSCTFFFIFSISDNGLMKFIVVDLLAKDSTMTGRTDIYLNVFSLLPGHLWSGYGYGSTYEVCMDILGAPNTQNGLLELLVQHGIMGVVLFFVLMFMVFKKNSYLKTRLYSRAIVAMIYIYIVLASVEITLGLEFFVLLAILTVCSEMDKQYNLNAKWKGDNIQDEGINSLNAENY